MTNNCAKGKRVERNIVNWLKERGCLSARRSAQHCGLPTDGSTGLIDNSDVLVPEELPSWHIESKGTKAPKLPACKVRSWFKQLSDDCPPGKLGVVLHTADAYSPVALLPLDIYKGIALEVGSMSVAAEESFSPAPELDKMEKGCRIYAVLTGKGIDAFRFTGAIAFEPAPGHIIIAIKGALWLAWAMEYEKKIKAAEPVVTEPERPTLVAVK